MYTTFQEKGIIMHNLLVFQTSHNESIGPQNTEPFPWISLLPPYSTTFSYDHSYHTDDLNRA